MTFYTSQLNLPLRPRLYKGGPELHPPCMIIACSFLIQLCLGTLYSWAVFIKPISVALNVPTDKIAMALPIHIVSFGLSAACIAPSLLTQFGPRVPVLIGVLMFALSHILTAIAPNSMYVILSYGIVGGIGSGVAYLISFRIAVQWILHSKFGVGAGIVTAGFGLGAIIGTLVGRVLVRELGVTLALVLAGIGCAMIQIPSAILLRANTIPANSAHPLLPLERKSTNPSIKLSLKRTLIQLVLHLTSASFILIYITFLLCTAAGVVVLSKLELLASSMYSVSSNTASMIVVANSLANACGCIGFGKLSDYWGRSLVWIVVTCLQVTGLALLTSAVRGIVGIPGFCIGAWLHSAAYGAGFAIVPGILFDLFGELWTTVMYGVALTGWSIAGILGETLFNLLTSSQKPVDNEPMGFQYFVNFYWMLPSTGLAVLATYTLHEYLASKPSLRSSAMNAMN